MVARAGNVVTGKRALWKESVGSDRKRAPEYTHARGIFVSGYGLVWHVCLVVFLTAGIGHAAISRRRGAAWTAAANAARRREKPDAANINGIGGGDKI